jgi:dUTP pyrophosphatase
MIKFKLNEGVKLPQYETEKAVGMDITANTILKVYKGDEEITGERLEKVQHSFERNNYIKIRGYERILFGTGLYADIPENIELQVRPRSGFSLKKGLIVTNSPGTIDPDYKGEIGIIISNTTSQLNTIIKGERIAQLVPKEVIRPAIEEIQAEDYTIDTERGEKGYGSTGE